MTLVRKRWQYRADGWHARGDDPILTGPVSRPVPAFTVLKSSLTVHVDATMSTDEGASIVAYAWTYGDGTTASGVTPAGHTYPAPGTYPITLTVTDDLGNSATASKTVSVSNLLAVFTISNVVALSLRVTANTSSTTPVASYVWTFGDGTTSSGPVVDHTYPVAGSYPITLTVTGTDGDVATQTQTATVSVPVGNPTAAFSTATSGRVLTVDASASATTNGYTISSYVWQWGDGTGNGSGKTATHTYATNGSYPVRLVVTDTSGQTATSSTTVTVASTSNVSPTAAFSTAVSNLTVTFDASASVDPDGTVASYSWTFGDGATGTGKTTSHTYAAAGSYTTRLTVTDNLSATGTVSKAVTVTSVPTGGGGGVPNWDHIVIVVEENHTYSSVAGSPYFASLISGGLNFTQSFGVAHPSEPNYFALFSGSTQGISNDAVYWYHSANLYTQLVAAGATFKGYSESLPSVGFTGASSGAYARKHSPWVSWQTDATSNPSGNVPGTIHRPFTEWQNTTAFYAALPKVTFVIPNLNDDMHDGTIGTADTWLRSHLDGYAQWAKSNNSLLIVTTDEDDGSAGNHIYTVAYGAHITPGSTYTAKINHYDVLGLIQDACGVPRLAGSVGKPSITSPWTGGTVTPPTTVLGDGGGTGTTPTGTGYGTLTGGTFSARVNSAGSSATVALPAGTYTFSDFADGTGAGGFWYGAQLTVTALRGAGSRYTTVQMVPNTSTRASSVPAQSTGQSNQLQYVAMSAAGAKVDGVKIQGTSQGHLYNGLRFESVASPTLSNTTVAGIPGDAGSPPGETFAVNFQACTGTVTVTNVTVDGQNLGAAAIGSNNSAATYNITNYLAINNKYSAGWASWEHKGVMNFHGFVVRNSARAFNAERLAGTVNFYDPLWDDPFAGHFDVNPTYETGWAGGTLNFYFTAASNWNAFIAARTNKTITAVSNSSSVSAGLVKGTVIKVYVAGVLQTQSNYVTWTGI